MSIEYKLLIKKDLKKELDNRKIKYSSKSLKAELIELLIQSDIDNTKKSKKEINNITKSNNIKKRKNRNDEESAELEEINLKRIKQEQEKEEERTGNLFLRCFRNIAIRREIYSHLKKICSNYYYKVEDINKLINHQERSYINTIHFTQHGCYSIFIEIKKFEKDIANLENILKDINNNVNNNNSNIVNGINKVESIHNGNKGINKQDLIYQITQKEKEFLEFKNKLKFIIPHSVSNVKISGAIKILEKINLPNSVSSVEITDYYYSMKEFELPESVKTLSLGDGNYNRTNTRVLGNISPSIETLNLKMNCKLLLNNDQPCNLKTINFYEYYSTLISSLPNSVEKITLSKFFDKRNIRKEYYGLVQLK
ncbi:hypothetical protein DICPUDRAFT_74971 [Dictyostelium purpureum]|uniref:SAP domain-containing protein n=1 Tax=Dictyostelium purpureum TaxID=5786 RepID=F0Z997_DICPU|nr:uncharacterized protein DICPUDRAFT_74971 [Dictyostelium purpureum]EGC39464.1 hypothetical protein DICPUDRAFT_74971 [Dictyostelium purpureum]|eukprot:XP_003284022.1 hypothetical protein DICPUDRAFT_74971 [Dictyostelium purpureum]